MKGFIGSDSFIQRVVIEGVPRFKREAKRCTLEESDGELGGGRDRK